MEPLQPQDVWFLKRMCGVEAPLVIEPDVERRLTEAGYLTRDAGSVRVTTAGHAFLAEQGGSGSLERAESSRTQKRAG